MKNSYHLCCLLLLVLFSCKNDGKKEETYTQGTTEIIVDESLEPIIDDQLLVFNSSYPDANIKMVYKPESTVLNLLMSDSISVAILSRTLTEKERKHFDARKIKIRDTRFAIDGVALITHESSTDTAVTVRDIIDVMEGKKGAIKSLVFDNANSSTVSYLMGLSKVNKLPASGVYALKSNPEVIRYVHDNPGTIGVVGLNWIEQPDSAAAPIVARLKYVGVKNLPGKPGSDTFYTPNQTSLALNQYPLKRELYIINCSGKPGLGTGFASFIAGERGQRIVLKSGLLPDSIPSRQILIKK